jgi:hypothetical protein
MLIYSISIPFVNLYTRRPPFKTPDSNLVSREWTLLGNWIVGVLILTNCFG